MRMKYFAGAAALAALSMAAAPSAFAQATTGGVAGRVVDDAGKPVAGATVVVTHVPTGGKTTVMTNAQGYYSALNQRVGGPYQVTVHSKDFGDESVDVAAIGIGDPATADVTLHAGTAVKQITVTASRTKDSMGPETRVNQQTLQTLPSLARDIRDYARLSPYAVLDPTNNNALIIQGQNSRSNTVTIDGVKQSDNFGLNSNGYPTFRNPISMDVIQALSVDVAPYDVTYGDFQGGTVNVVTKSGSNDFHGTAFYEYDNNHLRGSSFYAPGSSTATPYTSALTEKTWGVTLTGPIWKDHIFFVLNYENYWTNQAAGYGPSDSNALHQVPDVTTAAAATVQNILTNQYGYNPMSWQQGSLPTKDHKFFAKVDWNLNDQHRAVFEYQKTDGAQLSTGTDSTSTSSPTLSLLSNWYTLQENLTVEKAQLFSHWNDALSTEVSYSHREMQRLLQPLDGDNFAQFQVYLTAADLGGAAGAKFNANGSLGACSSTTPCPSIVLGPNLSYQANSLVTKEDQGRIKADYRLGDHTITAGYEIQHETVFNEFIQYANAAYVFDGLNPSDSPYCLTCGEAYSITYQNAYDNNKQDGAATFGYLEHTLYLQDQWQVLPNLTLRGGLRYDVFQMTDKPLANPLYQANFGFPNTNTLDGMSVLQPRFGFNWRPDFDKLGKLQVYGGYGLFQGGDPLVWVSDSFSNTGTISGSVKCNQTQLNTPACALSSTPNQTLAGNNPLANVNGNKVAQIFQQLNSLSASQGTGYMNAIAPGTEPVSIWKGTLGVTDDFSLSHWGLGDGWHARAEYVRGENDKAFYWYDAYMQAFKSGANAPDGRPFYGLTTTSGQPVFGSVNRLNLQNVVMADTNKGWSEVWMVELGKTWRQGLLAGLNLNLSYTNTGAKDVNDGQSSVATSNIKTIAYANPNNPALSTSGFEIRDAAKLELSYAHKWFGDNTTRIGLFAQYRSGLHYSYVFNDANSSSNSVAAEGMYGYNGLYTNYNSELFYVPKMSNGMVTPTSDPLVTYGAMNQLSATNPMSSYKGVAMPLQMAQFNQWLAGSGLMKYAGQIAPRNGFTSPHLTTLDLHFSQEFPASIPIATGKIEAYMDILNLTNLLNPHWGVLSQVGYPYFISPVTARNCQAQAQAVAAANNKGVTPASATCSAGAGNFYQYDSFTQKTGETEYSGSSVWQIKVGFRFKF